MVMTLNFLPFTSLRSRIVNRALYVLRHVGKKPGIPHGGEGGKL
jgi:hypothetical protein